MKVGTHPCLGDDEYLTWILFHVFYPLCPCLSHGMHVFLPSSYLNPLSASFPNQAATQTCWQGLIIVPAGPLKQSPFDSVKLKHTFVYPSSFSALGVHTPVSEAMQQGTRKLRHFGDMALGEPELSSRC